jgi:spermidine synthase
MDELIVGLRRERAVRALIPLFFVSGATGLVYQTIWGRQLHLVFGTSTFAIATVLTAFMAGLALGGHWMSKRADTTADPMRLYGLIEVGIGLYALAFPMIVGAVEPAYRWIWQTWSPSPAVFGAAQMLIVGSTLLIPTAMMGATLPLLARFATDRLGAAGDRVGELYAVNTAGAVAGTWLAGFVLLPWLGLWTTTCLAAAANLALGAVAIGLAGWSQAAGVGVVARDVEGFQDVPEVPVRLLVSAAFAGFASLLYEVAWFRVLGLMLGASVYAFSVMLLAFLIGIAAGARVGGPLGDRLLQDGGRPAVLRALAWVEVGVGAASFLMMHLFQELPFWYVWLFDAVSAEQQPGLMWVVSMLIAGLIMTGPAVLMGMAFPLTVRAAIGRPDALGEAVGRVYAYNTAGGVLGAALAGFVLLPGLAVQGTILVGTTINVLAAGLVWSLTAPGREALQGVRAARLGAAVASLGLVGVIWPPAWDPLLMTAGMYKYVTSFRDHSRAGILDYAVSQYELLYYREGLSSVVTVARNLDSGNLWLANNGKVDASTTIDMPTQVMVSLLPLQFVEEPRTALVIGLASGITAGAVSLVEDLERIDVVELEPAIVDAARLFDDYNHHVLDDPRVTLHLNDGRNHVLLAEPGSYDIVVSEPSNPWLTGVSNLFTREFFELGRTRLAPGGVWSQWVQLYGMDDHDLRSLLGTFADVYPYVLVYAAAEDADIVLLGADHPLIPTPARAERLFTWPPVEEELRKVKMGDAPAILASLMMDRDGVVALAGDTRRNTDDNMRIEYNAPRNLHRDTQRVNVPMLHDASSIPFEAVGEDPDFLLALARAYERDHDPDRAIDAALRAGLLRAPEDPDREEALEQAFSWYAEERSGEAFESLDAKARAVLLSEFRSKRVEPMLEAAGVGGP